MNHVTSRTCSAAVASGRTHVGQMWRLILPPLILWTCGTIEAGDNCTVNESQAVIQESNHTLVFPGSPVLSNDTVVFPKRCQSQDGTPGFCQPLATCIFSFKTVTQLEKSLCEDGLGIPGVCCPSKRRDQSPEAGAMKRPSTEYEPGTSNVPMPKIPNSELSMAVRVGTQYATDLGKMEAALAKKGLVVQKGSKEAYHLAFFGAFNKEMSQVGMVALHASVYLAKAYGLNRIQVQEGLPRISMRFADSVPKFCSSVQRACRPSKYRTADGSCNNLEYRDWGKSFTALQRLLPPAYADGLSAPRIARDMGPLPSARDVSMTAVPDHDVPDSRSSLMLMQWAQFVDHDLTLTTLTRSQDGHGLICCHPEVQANPRLMHPACLPISIPSTDPFYGPLGQTCMEFVRSLPAPRRDCALGPREQMNQLTAFLDGSNVYGSTEKQALDLREMERGRLRVRKILDKEMLPLETNANEECSLIQKTEKFFCFKGGDERVNEHLTLTAMHTLWMRQHNRVAGQLSSLNPHWDDERIYQETRRFVVAQLQHITFSEFLPMLLGHSTMEKFELTLLKEGFSEAYNPSVNPSIANVFAAAAYRFGHTLVQSHSPMMSKRGEVLVNLPLRNQFFNPEPLQQPSTLDLLLQGLLNTPAQKYDRFVTSQLTSHLFQQQSHDYGMDLVALNVQRAREHGVPSYNDWRAFCHLPRVRHFHQLTAIMHPDSAEAFRRLYRHVDDIDLFPAGISEFSLPNATLGPTFACLVAEQFRRLKRGDRFWYENGGLLGSFTSGQLAEIRKTTLARIICDNSDDIDRIQANVFLRRNSQNRRFGCHQHRRIAPPKLDPWREVG